MERIIAVNSNCYHGYTLDDAIKGISAAGFRYIELTATKGWTEHVFPTMSFAELCEIRQKLKDAGLTPFSMSGHTNLMDTARIGDFVNNIQLAGFFGCNYIVSSIGEAHLEDKAVAADETVAQHIQNLVPYLEESGLELVLELHGEHATGRRMKNIVELVGSPLVNINYDTANVLYFSDADELDDFAASINRVTYMHLKDKAGERKVWNFPALGQGYVPFPEIFAMLEKANNNCPFSIEIEFTSEGAKDAAEIDAAVLASAGYLQSQGFTL